MTEGSGSRCSKFSLFRRSTLAPFPHSLQRAPRPRWMAVFQPGLPERPLSPPLACLRGPLRCRARERLLSRTTTASHRPDGPCPEVPGSGVRNFHFSVAQHPLLPRPHFKEPPDRGGWPCLERACPSVIPPRAPHVPSGATGPKAPSRRRGLSALRLGLPQNPEFGSSTGVIRISRGHVMGGDGWTDPESSRITARDFGKSGQRLV